MSSTENRESHDNKLITDFDSQYLHDSVLEKLTETETKIKPSGTLQKVVILQEGKLIPCSNLSEPLIATLTTPSTSNKPIEISQNTSPLNKSLHNKTKDLKMPLVQKGNTKIGVKRLINITNSQTLGCLKPVSQIKTNIEVSDQSKKFKAECLTEDININSDIKLLNTSQGSIYCVTDSGEKTSNEISDNIHDSLNMDTEVDHGYSLYYYIEDGNELHKNQDITLIEHVVTEDLEGENSKQTNVSEKESIEVKVVKSPSPKRLSVPCKSLSKQYNLKNLSLPHHNTRNTQLKNHQHLSTPSSSKSVTDSLRNLQQESKRPRINDKLPKLPVPANINQYGDCLKTRLGGNRYGVTLNEPPTKFFQGVLKGASGQTLAVMFGDVHLISKMESESLNEIRHFIMDSTFTVNPSKTKGINQVFIISVRLQYVVIPVWYAVMACSSPELYKKIIIEFHQHTLDWCFSTVLVDNNPDLCKAIRAVFPDIELYGSWFHYCQSIWKEISLLNLTEHCKEENCAMLTAVKLLMVLPFLPASATDVISVTMADGFEYVREFARKNNVLEEFEKVLDYVALFWFNEVKPENFTIFWKQGCALNHIQVLQRLLLSYMKEGGNIWMFNRSLQLIARTGYTDFVRLMSGRQQIMMRIRSKKVIGPIGVAMKKFRTGTLDMKTYLERSMLYLNEILDIFLHPLYQITSYKKTNYTHFEGWSVRVCSNLSGS